MSAIEATSVRVQTMADDTLRLVVDIEPRFANDAFKLFGKAGQPMALAALKPASSKPEPEERPFRGELCRWAAIRCTEEQFRRWMTEANDWAVEATEEQCAEFIREVCGVESRVELDTNSAAGKKFHHLIRAPYAKWLKENPQ